MQRCCEAIWKRKNETSALAILPTDHEKRNAFYDTVLHFYISGIGTNHHLLEWGADFKTAYIQAYILLVVMNWFNGIVVYTKFKLNLAEE